jgi:hypothetical protein
MLFHLECHRSTCRTCRLVLSQFPKVLMLVSGVLQLPSKIFLGVEDISLHHSPHSRVGLSHLSTLIPSWDGVVLWVVDSNPSACHLLLTLSRYLVGLGAIIFPHLECQQGETPSKANGILHKGCTLHKGCHKGETPFSVRTIQCKGVSLRKGCQ